MAKKMKNALVTGGVGFIGSHLTQRLLRDGWKVTVIDDLTEGKWENLPSHPNLKKHKISISGNISPFIVKGQVIFHLAALPGVQRSIADPVKTHDVNVTSTFNLLIAARDAGVKKFVFSSGFVVYGEQKRLPFTEDLEPAPMSPYALHKQIGEQYCKLFSDLWGLNTICLRYFNVYGPGMDLNSALANIIPKFTKIMSQDKAPVINGKGEQTRDFIYIDDVIEANLLAARSQISGEVFNIGSGRNISVNKVVGLINKFMGKNIKPIYGPGVIEQKSTLASFAKAKRLLGWKPKVKFEDGLKMVIENLNQ